MFHEGLLLELLYQCWMNVEVFYRGGFGILNRVIGEGLVFDGNGIDNEV